MLPLYKKYWRTAFDIGLIALTVFLIMFVSSKLYQIAAPVFLSFLVFIIIEPLAKFLHRKGIKKAIASAISVLLFLGILLGIFFGLGVIVVSSIVQFQDNIPYYTEMIQTQFNQFMTFLHTQIDALPASVTNQVNDYFEVVTQTLSAWGKIFIGYIITMLSSFSSFIGNFAVAMILAFFLSVEIDIWRALTKRKAPNTIKQAYLFVKNHVLISIGSYLKAQLILISITFILVYVGLLIVGTGNALTIALVSAFFDLLPLLGIPVIFIPWIIYLFIVGNTGTAIGLIIVLVVTMLTRQLAEPKISGNSIGVTSAYLMLSFMLISLSIFGIAGVILSPILLILIKELLQQGYLQRWIHLPEDEFQTSPFIVDDPVNPREE
ncbi:AI-2E family transporter [Paenibacillus sp. Marseille-Q4541]|uniref:AI-2E family transporter n=1 Tax=Paenibacillus sp. Marseille-Q4541 TaxID=2831522 RepID=UPI001BACF580|nr:AI-2E family transporter [Paenibacillus sp. Marseille-Q4541]